MLPSPTKVLARKPAWSGSMPDPFVFATDAGYFAIGTAGPSAESNGCVFPVLFSEDLQRWRHIGGALIPPDPSLGNLFWAPEVVLSEGRFHLYYSVGTDDGPRQQLRVATSADPAGPYEDTGAALVDPGQAPFCIDPHPFRDDDGQWYLFYARDFLDTTGGCHAGTALVVDRLSSMHRLAGQETCVLRARFDWTLWQRDRWMPGYGRSFDWHTLEGPCVSKRDGLYYLFYSGSCYLSDRYGVDWAIGSSVRGPYDDSGGASGPRLLRSIDGVLRGPGHHSIVSGPDGQSEHVAYHAWNTDRTTRQMHLDPLIWTGQGPRCGWGLGKTVI